jgi:CubicO group peptidase (beta-lactamase class C family)
MSLDDLLSYAMDRNSVSVVVAVDGEVVAERHASGPTHAQDVYTAQKSVTALLVGMAASRGLLALGDPIEGHENVTIRHLLTMTSGLDDALTPVAEPGTVWHYNTPAYQLLRPLLERVSGHGIQELSRAWLFEPIGAGGATWFPRAGSPLWGLSMSAHDLVRVGELVLDPGDVLDVAFLRDVLSTSQPLNPSYGYLWWLNGKAANALPMRGLQPGPLIPCAPSDVVAALGAAGQKLYVCSSARLAVSRIGGPPTSGVADAMSTSFDDELWQRIVAAGLV